MGRLRFVKACNLLQRACRLVCTTGRQATPAMPLRDPSVSTLFGYMDTSAGVSVTEWTALNYSAFWAANKIYGEAVASLPAAAHDRKLDDGSKKEVTDHPARDRRGGGPQR
jgi:hypothetical protein